MLKPLILAALAFTTLAASAQIAPPTIPSIKYQFWPEQMVQYLGNEVPYSMIILQMDTKRKEPAYDLALTPRVAGKPIHYSNVPDLVALNKAMGYESYAAKFEFVRPDAAVVGSTYTLKTTLHDGSPLEWRFVQGSDITEQGAGLTALPEAPVPVLAYREVGGVAGEGTALQIGDKVSVADMWKEISQPPYFIAYHGALTQNSTQAVLAGGETPWNATASPSTLAAGSEWVLTQPGGPTRHLKIEKVAGDYVTMGFLEGVNKETIEATHTATGWTIERIQIRPGDLQDAHALSIAFAPGTAEFIIGKKTKIATATETVTDGAVTLTMATPAWIKGKTAMTVAAK